MCGIIGYLGQRNAIKYILIALDILQNRGYDSAGLSVVSNQNNKKLILQKYCGGYENKNDTDCKQNNNTGTQSFATPLDKLHNWWINYIRQSNLENFDYTDYTVGIGHTRWATHGKKTTQNAHPHICSMYGIDIVLVHNGIIENFTKLKHDLQTSAAHMFSSETDSEVVAHLIAREYELLRRQCIDSQPLSIIIFQAFHNAILKLEGTWAIAMICKQLPDELFVSKRGSPLLLGFDEQQENVWAASELSAMQRWANRWMAMQDGQILRISKSVYDNKLSIQYSEHIHTTTQQCEQCMHFSVDMLEKIDREATVVSHQLLDSTTLPTRLSLESQYKHFTEKEIIEQQISLWNVLSRGGRIENETCVKLGGIDQYKNDLLACKHLYLIGCGSSLYAAHFSSYLFCQLSGFGCRVHCIDASELATDFPQIEPDDNVCCVFISQSGETKDLLRALESVRHINPQSICVGVINAVASTLARQTDCGVYLGIGKEIGVASTKSFTAQVTVLWMIALWFAQNRNRNTRQRRQYIDKLLTMPHIYETEMKSTRQWCQLHAPRLSTSRTWFILGKQYGYSIAREASLKLKELTYLHVEAYPGGALKHGPFAVIDKDTPIFVLILNDQHKSKMISAYHELITRNCPVYVITNDEHVCNTITTTPLYYIAEDNSYVSCFISLQLFQWLAYETAVFIGNNPDRPRNLAKSVTVD